jgi:predicted MPP superfamily phosphohydrolase
LFVTVGVGAWFPLRVNCPAEIALVTAKTLK